MKKAFTLLELVFVIVVIGILAAVIMPRTKTNPVQEAAIQVLSHIRYTQHLALVDDKYDAHDAQWYKTRWQIFFSTDNSGNGDQVYTIYSDTNKGGGANSNEIAIDPSTQKLLSGDSLYNNHIARMNLSSKYGISAVNLTGGCNNSKRISFDYLGRPFMGDPSALTGFYSPSVTNASRLITSDCNITLTNGTESATIQISPETGYAKVIF